MIVAMDGPSGTGKSTVSRRLAIRLGAGYLDTGAMYRAATVWVLDSGIDPENAAAVAAIADAIPLEIGTDPAIESVRLNGLDVGERIRTREVTAAVSAVSAVPRIRVILVEQQRRAAAAHDHIVVEGRDIGTVVFPRAEIKIYLTASAEVRARRRVGQSGGDYATTLADIERRDLRDSTRPNSPLRKADDAIEVDTSDLGRDEVIDRLVGIVEERMGATETRRTHE
ncbi:(d)CMP kinase [Millisia brevis]|uniref:(d)CMP kinase n=1 Tax=Millisia brevis TaxID=264148 RepID=UPI000833CF15|nr:(d)CMP kinase [Millisia brevis]